MPQDNRFTPPAAQVADPEPQHLLPERPGQVRLAVALLWVSFVLGIPSWVLSASRDPEQGYGAVSLTLTALLFAFVVWLNVLIYKGTNWARIVNLVFALLGLLFLLLPMEEATPPGTLERTIYAVDMLVQAVATYLLFTRPGSLWFKRRR